MLPPTTVHGKAAYALEITPKMPAAMPAAMRKVLGAPLNFVVDEQSLEVIRITRHAGTNTLSVDVARQVVNGPEPESEFAIHIPPGFKEVQMRAPAGPGMAPPRGQPGPPRR
jgi:hypothetical protein